MISSIKNINTLVLFLYKISKYQILTHPENINFSKSIKFLGSIVCLVMYPLNFFIKPKQSFGERLTGLFKDLGPIYIKFGQTISTRPDLFGKEIAKHLRSLQDKLPSFDISIVKIKIEKDFRMQISQIFSDFEEIPIAAASIAQVHRATLISGERVAVKILRPNITKQYNNDITFLTFVAKYATQFIKSLKRLKLCDVINAFRESMNCELNFMMEAAAASRFADNCLDDDDIYVPQIYWNLTSNDIITLEWIDGVSIYDKKNLIDYGLNPESIASKIAVIFFNQAYRDGFFHADLHPGNIIIKPNGQVALIDFGIIGLLSEDDRLAIAELLYAFLKRDYKLVASIHYKVGYIPKSTNLELFAQKCRAIAEPIINKKVKNISVGNLLAQLFKITKEFGMETQPQLLLLQKTMVVVEGIGQSLDSEINMWRLAEPWIKKWAIKNLSPEAKLMRTAKKYINNFLD